MRCKVLLVLAAAALLAAGAFAAPGKGKPPVAGKPCPKAGATGTSAAGAALACRKKGAKLVWTAAAAPKPKPATTPASTGTTTTTAEPAPTADLVLSASPVDLSQIGQISRFRSCAGHDYSGVNADGQPETNRSMKHYFAPAAPFVGSTGQIKEFAPVSGTISDVQSDQTPRGQQVWLSAGSGFGAWSVVFFHMDLVSGLGQGSTVTAGRLIGYAAARTTSTSRSRSAASTG